MSEALKSCASVKEHIVAVLLGWYRARGKSAKGNVTGGQHARNRRTQPRQHALMEAVDVSVRLREREHELKLAAGALDG